MAEFRIIGDSEPDAGFRDSTITAPIDTLPNELIAHIFTMGSTSEPPRLYRRTSRSLPFPLLVSSISRRWRDAAISSPPLWSRLLFTATLADSWISRLFLPRSGTHPLDIHINLEYAVHSMERVLEIILPHCERWRTLCVNRLSLLKLTLPAIRDISVPLLQHVEILGQYEASGVPAHTSHTPFFQLGAPALTSVSLRSICAECGPPLANLTAFLFDYKGPLSQQCLESIVAASPGLQVLRLASRTFEGSGQGPIHIPSLRQLSLNFGGCTSDDDFIRLFAIIIAPDLESLEIVSMSEIRASRLLFHCTQSSSYPRPRTLKLSKLHDVTLPSYHALFSLFPTVTSLSLLDGDSNPALSQLPALKHITYGRSPYYFPFFSAKKGKEDSFIDWICGHVRGCHGTPQAMESVHTNRLAHTIRETIGCLVDVVVLANGADSLRDSWASDNGDGSLIIQSDDDFDGVWGS
ncbi:hypothetical protein FIBSPDRAFT_936033 [Athelia psychrophila]|uniref:Uncharacterized protein n=1 Tax=Athelia psychrophila TaxID=1759441 RepID=A0A166CQW4_9AGAM|nr:hypothetical protein FIBSPDRAFT_936033 [Fibularhizoctonia sp. CBS 109695]